MDLKTGLHEGRRPDVRDAAEQAARRPRRDRPRYRLDRRAARPGTPTRRSRSAPGRSCSTPSPPASRASSSAIRTYWMGDGRPYVDELVIISIPDATARANALLAGRGRRRRELRLPAGEEAAGRRARRSSSTRRRSGRSRSSRGSTRSRSRTCSVRQAMKLAIDRQALVDTVFFGFGVVGNDQFGKNGPPRVLQRRPAAAGVRPRRGEVAARRGRLPRRHRGDPRAGTRLRLPGPRGRRRHGGAALPAAGEGGRHQLQDQPDVEHRPVEHPRATRSPRRGGARACPSSSTGSPIETAATTRAGSTPSGTRSSTAALAELDEAKRKELWNEVQAQFYEESGHIIWGHYNVIDGLAPNVQGAYANSWPLEHLRLQELLACIGGPSQTGPPRRSPSDRRATRCDGSRSITRSSRSSSTGCWSASA